jgi:hypothetical protein
VLTFQSAELDNRLQLLQSASDNVLAQLDGSEHETMQRLLQLKTYSAFIYGQDFALEDAIWIHGVACVEVGIRAIQ